MKKTSKLLVLFVVLSLLISMVSVSAFAETAPYTTTMTVGAYDDIVERGEKNKNYSFDLGLAYDQVATGTITVIGGEGVINNIRLLDTVSGSEVKYSYDALANGEATFTVYPRDNVGETFSQGLEVWFDVLNSAPVGSECQIVITYDIYGTDSNEPINLVKCEGTIDLVVVSSATPVDYTALDEQLDRAKAFEGMSRYYPAEAYAAFEAALKNAKAVRTLRNQKRVDEATEALKTAIDNLGTPFDYSGLASAIENVKLPSVDFTTEGLQKAWTDFVVAFENGKAIFTNGAASQQEIDDAANAINTTFAALMNAVKALEDATTGTTIVPGETVTVTVPVPGETVTVPGETVEVEVPGESPMHWLILFIIFAIISLILAILLIVSLVKKNNNKNDTNGIDGPEVDEDGAMEDEAEASAEEGSEEASEE